MVIVRIEAEYWNTKRNESSAACCDRPNLWSRITRICADGMPLVNDRVGHGAQFSVSTRLAGHSRYGGEFNFLGYGHWFGHIGDIRISDVRRLS